MGLILGNKIGIGKVRQASSSNPPPAMTWESAGLDAGLVSYIGFDEESGTVFANKIETSNDANVTAGTVTPNQIGQVGKAIGADATGKLSCAIQPGLLAEWAFTISTRFKPSVVISAELYTVFDPSSRWVAISSQADGSFKLTLRTFLGSPGMNNSFFSATGLCIPNEWHLLTVTYDSINVILRLNDVSIITVPYPHGFNLINIIQLWKGSGNAVGMFDETAIWNRCLTDVELTNHYALGLAGVGKI